MVISVASVNRINAQQTLFIDKQEYSCASAFNIAVRTKKINNVVAMQGTVIWDTSVVKYNGISYGSSAIALDATNMNLSSTANGYLTFLWFDNNLQGRASIDSASLFTINFTTNGTGKGTGLVQFANTPTPMEIDTLWAGNIPVNNTAAVFTDGYVVTPYFYNFTGAGNWTVASNWKDNMVPPAVLPACSEIIIGPASINECILDIPQTISTGAKITVIAGKRLTIAGNLILQ